MSYYGGTITVKGRNLITSLMAGETIEFTRVVVGSGEMPEGIEPLDMADLVEPVADATSSVPVVKNVHSLAYKGEDGLVRFFRSDKCPRAVRYLPECSELYLPGTPDK